MNAHLSDHNQLIMDELFESEEMRRLAAFTNSTSPPTLIFLASR